VLRFLGAIAAEFNPFSKNTQSRIAGGGEKGCSGVLYRVSNHHIKRAREILDKLGINTALWARADGRQRR